MKTLRRIIQWSVFLLFLTGFLSFLPVDGGRLFTVLPRLQLFPALIRFPLIAACILLITFLFGRVYCSSLCPLATIQDLLTPRKRRFSHRNLSFLLRYLVPAASLTLLFVGYPALASVADPYSMAGRIVSSVNELVILPFVDLLGLILRRFSLYITTYPIQFRWETIAISAASVTVLSIMSRVGGRLYCNTLCPVGALLSVPARWAVFGHRINIYKCTSCGACERVCKAEAIAVSSKSIDTSKCVSCFNCNSVCNFDALFYGRKQPSESKSVGRRDFLKKSIFGSAWLFIMPARASGLGSSIRQDETSPAAVPPGADSLGSFLSHCTACSLCISRCLGNVLQPAAVSQYGMKGFGVPYMDFNKGSCEFECNLCSTLCPSGAIRPVLLDVKKQIKIGEAQFVREKCVVETDATSCGACGEICPTGAIEMLHIGDSPDGALEIPLIYSKYCIGCGACQFVCPVLAKDAIFVNAFSKHEVAEARVEPEDSEPVDVDNDFAF